jgi:outer membrane autotransporter protein
VDSSPVGTVVSTKNIELRGGVLEVEIDIENGRNDVFVVLGEINEEVGGEMILDGGTIRVKPVRTENAGGNIARGSMFTIAKSIARSRENATSPVKYEDVPLRVEFKNMPEVIQNLLDAPESNENFILLAPDSGIGTAYADIAKEGLTLLVGQKELSRVPGYKAHEGLDGFHAALDSVATLRVPPFSNSDITDNFVAWYEGQKSTLDALSHLSAEDARKKFADAVKALVSGLPTGVPASSDPVLKQTYEWLVAAYEIGAFLNTASESALRPLVNNLSPLGYSSLVAMPATVASNNVDQLRARIEQRRYDRSQFISSGDQHLWQAYVIGASGIFKNGDGADSATYDFNTQGGIVGADVLAFDQRGVVGGAVEYTNGSSTLDDGGGKIKLNAVRATGYLSYQLGDWFYLDAGAGGGYMSYDAKRTTATGVNEASPEGWQAGGFALLGSVFAIQKDYHFTPYAGFEYNHYEVFGFTEKGSRSRLKVDDFGFDSLRAKIGSGLAWVSGGYDWNWKIGVDVAYAHELLDTESDISSRFALDPFGLTNSKTRSKTLSRDVLQLAPTATLNLTEQTSVFASYRWEYGFEGEVRHNLNAGIRFRF